MRNLVFLTGFMGTGKTAVGRELGRRLGLRFVDLDEEIERSAGMSVAEIFARFGEAEFRSRERAAIERVSAFSDAVVATGGGAVIDSENRRLMRTSGKVVCLRADVTTILDRVGGGDDRPLLAGARNPEERAARVRELLDRRRSAYEDADFAVDTSARTVAAIADEIAAGLGAR